MTTKHAGMGRGLGAMLLLVVASMGLTGCEADSFMDPSTVGRWEHTPVTLPILDRLDVIDEPGRTSLEITQVRREDLIPDRREYVIGAGDTLTVAIFELIYTGQESVQSRRVDEVGMIRLPVVGAVRAAGMTSRQLEDSIRQTLENEGILRDAMVSVTLLEARQNTFSVLGSPRTDGTAVGTYVIPKPEFRLLDAVAMARGIDDRTRRVLIYRQTTLTPEASGDAPLDEQTDQPDEQAPQAPENPEELIGELFDEANQQPVPRTTNGDNGNGDRPAAPSGMEAGLESEGASQSHWVYVGDEWVQVQGSQQNATAGSAQDANRQLGEVITQRIIEVPYDRLVEGDMRYNVVIRPGDVIRVPGSNAGFVYVMGEINRPGAYVVPGEDDLTLKQLIASAGGLGQLAIPERVDLTRRIDGNMETTVRLNVKAIFDGTQPDIFMKPNDLVNVGTSFVATPLAIFRNGFRATYGFGFVLDRNFADDVFGESGRN